MSNRDKIVNALVVESRFLYAFDFFSARSGYVESVRGIKTQFVRLKKRKNTRRGPPQHVYVFIGFTPVRGLSYSSNLAYTFKYILYVLNIISSIFNRDELAAITAIPSARS